MEFTLQAPAIFAHPELDEEHLVSQDGDEVVAPDPDTVIGEEEEEDEEDGETVE